jgi:hypothetical protein
VLILQARRHPGLSGRVQSLNNSLRRNLSHQMLVPHMAAAAGGQRSGPEPSTTTTASRLSTPLLRLRADRRHQPPPLQLKPRSY